MNYTESLDNIVHAAAGQRMHTDTAALATVASAKDTNMVLWSLMEVLKAAELSGQSFDPDVPGTYQVLLEALNELYVIEQATEAAAGTAKIASQADVNAAANQDDTKFVTAKKLWGWVKQATETLMGMAKVATQAQTNNGTDDATIVTPKKLRAGFTYSMNPNGYLIFPAWLGGVIIQWGQGNRTGITTVLTLPITFPTAAVQAVAVNGDVNGAAEIGVFSFTASTITLTFDAASTVAFGRYFIVGH